MHVCASLPVALYTQLQFVAVLEARVSMLDTTVRCVRNSI